MTPLRVLWPFSEQLSSVYHWRFKGQGYLPQKLHQNATVDTSEEVRAPKDILAPNNQVILDDLIVGGGFDWIRVFDPGLINNLDSALRIWYSLK